MWVLPDNVLEQSSRRLLPLSIIRRDCAGKEILFVIEKGKDENEIKNVDSINGQYDAVFVIECSDLERPGIKGLENQFTVNIDHHASSAHFGTVNWIDSTASAVGEMIYNLCKAITN